MASSDWVQMLASALGGGITVKVLDIVYSEFRRRGEHQTTATHFVDEHLDPLLKAADELVAKMHALAREDFTTFLVNPGQDPFDNNDVGGLIFLFATFWGQLEIIRRHGLFVALNQDERGEHLQSFIASIESTRVRLVDRIAQRAIGEVMMDDDGGAKSTLRYIHLVRSYRENPDIAKWLAPLLEVLGKAPHRTQRQQILLYVSIVHAMIDALDPKHMVSRDRPAVANKLSEKTRQELQYRVFEQYLPFVRSPEKYFRPSADRTA